MKIKTTLAMIALALAPSVALAQGCVHENMSQSASQCAPGQVWDATSQTCVTPASS